MSNQHSATLSASSSPSSVDIESHHGTPGTKLTEFSPEDCRAEPKSVTAGGMKVNLPPTFALQGVPMKLSPNGKARSAIQGAQDPFTSNTSNVGMADPGAVTGPKLSPTAATFTPLQPTSELTIVNGSQVSAFGPPTSNAASQHLGVAYLNATSVPDSAPLHRKPPQNLLSYPGGVILPPIGPPAPGTLSSPSSNADGSSAGPCLVGIDCSRYFKISQVSTQTSPQQLNGIFGVSTLLIKAVHVLITSART